MRLSIVALAICLLTLSSCNQQQKEVDGSDYTIKWAIAHAPVKYFSQAAEEFKQIVEEKTDGKVNVEIITKFENNEHTSRAVLAKGLMGKIQTGEIQMGQIYTNSLAKVEPRFHVLDLPFLFESDAHVDRVVEGEIGNTLLASLDQHGLKGVGFTYSGGQVGLVSYHKPITKHSQLKNLRYRSFSNDVNQDYSQELEYDNYPSNSTYKGKRLVVQETLDANLVDAADVTFADAGDAIYKPQNRKARYFTQTGHAWLLTTLIMNGDFFSSLPHEYQNIVKQAAFKVARSERQHIISDGEALLKQVSSDPDVELIQLAEDERIKMKKTAKPVYDKYEKIVGRKLIDKIQSLKEPKKVDKKDALAGLEGL